MTDHFPATTTVFLRRRLELYKTMQGQLGNLRAANKTLNPTFMCSRCSEKHHNEYEAKVAELISKLEETIAYREQNQA